MKPNAKLPWLQAWTLPTVSAQDQPGNVVKILSPQIHEMGMAEAMLMLNAQTISIAKFFLADWDKSMAKDAAEAVYQEANWMTVAEFKYFISRMRGGKYPHKKNLSPAVFMECLNEFIHEILATRGAVNSYAWRDNRVPDESFPLPIDPATGKQGKPTDPDRMKSVLKTMAEHFREMERYQDEQDRLIREAKWQGIKDKRDQWLVDQVEQTASQGIAPDSYLTAKYFAALKQLARK